MTKKSIKSPAPKKAAAHKSVKPRYVPRATTAKGGIMGTAQKTVGKMTGAIGGAVEKVKGLLKKAWTSKATVKSATVRVRRELTYWGLLFPGSRMDEVEVIYGRWNLSGFVRIMGFYLFGVQEIHIPAFYPAGLFPGDKGRCITDVLRHEFGHALADKYSQFFHDKRFKKAFGDEYGRIKVAEDGDYISPYARTFTQEDFCETFMLFLKHKGVLPREFAWREAIRAKWEAVAAICSDIAELRK